MSQIKTIIDAITAAANNAAIGWNTAPTAVWYPDIDAEALKTRGLTCTVIAPERTAERTRRGPGGDMGDVAVHVAVSKPILPDEPQYDDGEMVVNAAEILAAEFIQLVGTGWFVFACEHSPIVSAEMAKNYLLWVSYLKLSVRAERF